jgi:hypothetical protein
MSAEQEKKITELMNGAIDLHIHSDPSFMVRSVDTLEAAEECWAAGMRAIAVKDHFTSTAANAYFANKYMHGPTPERPFDVYGSICLNNDYGFSLYAVDSALKFGARQVYMPTVASRSHIVINAAAKAAKADTDQASAHFIPQKVKAMPQTEMYILDADGQLLSAVKDIYHRLADSEAMLCTGHLDYNETLATVRYCRSIGFDRILLTHLPTFTTLDMEKLKVIVDIAGFVEVNESQIVEETPESVRNTREDLVGYIRYFGPERCVIATDAGSIAFPRPATAMRNAIAAYLDAGISEADINTMVAVNPGKLLGLV